MVRIKPGRIQDPEYLLEVKELPCVICGAWPSEAHHSKTRPDGEHYGMGQKAGDHETIALCLDHHRRGPEAYHSAPRAFQEKHGSELELIRKTRERIEEKRRREDPFAHLRGPRLGL